MSDDAFDDLTNLYDSSADNDLILISSSVEGFDVGLFLKCSSPASYIFEISNDNYRHLGLLKGDYVVIKRDIMPEAQHIVLAAIDGKFRLGYFAGSENYLLFNGFNRNEPPPSQTSSSAHDSIYNNAVRAKDAEQYAYAARAASPQAQTQFAAAHNAYAPRGSVPNKHFDHVSSAQYDNRSVNPCAVDPNSYQSSVNTHISPKEDCAADAAVFSQAQAPGGQSSLVGRDGGLNACQDGGQVNKLATKNKSPAYNSNEVNYYNSYKNGRIGEGRNMPYPSPNPMVVQQPQNPYFNNPYRARDLQRRIDKSKNVPPKKHKFLVYGVVVGSFRKCQL